MTAPPRPLPIGLSTASVFPESTAQGFERAAALGYDGVEVMVHAEPLSQNADGLRALIDRFQIPVLAVHSPCLLISSRVWTTDPLVKLERSLTLAAALGAGTVVVHPPFVWQRRATDDFASRLAEQQRGTPIRIAVENMFPVAVGRAIVNSYRPHWDPVPAGHRWFTLDLSHAAASRTDPIALAARMGRRLGHLHLTDGSGSRRDEHLVPGRGAMACVEVLAGLRPNGFSGSVIVEISTRRVGAPEREVDLAEALAFAHRHLR